MIQHMSDCTLHNGPALPVGPCDCGAELKGASRDDLRDRLSAVIEELMSRGGDITLRGGNQYGAYKVELKYD